MSPEPDDQKGHRKHCESRGGRPIGLDAVVDLIRNAIECRSCHTTHSRGFDTRFDKHAVTYRAAVALSAVIAQMRASFDTP